MGIQCKVKAGRGTWGEWFHVRSEWIGADAVVLKPLVPLTPACQNQVCPSFPSSAFSDFLFKQTRWEYLHHGNQQTLYIRAFGLGVLFPGELVCCPFWGLRLHSGLGKSHQKGWVEEWHKLFKRIALTPVLRIKGPTKGTAVTGVPPSLISYCLEHDACGCSSHLTPWGKDQDKSERCQLYWCQAAEPTPRLPTSRFPSVWRK